MHTVPLLTMVTILSATLLYMKSCEPKGAEDGELIQAQNKSSKPEFNCECGVKNDKEDDELSSRVINGLTVQPKTKYPWMIAIEKSEKHHCGATILSRRYVLSAAHCFLKPAKVIYPKWKNCLKLNNGEKYCSVPLSELRLRYFGDESGEKNDYVSISSYKFDARYTLPDFDYDIALLRTAEDLPCRPFTSPICLPKKDYALDGNATAKLVGWGRHLEGAKGKSSLTTLREANLIVTKSAKICKRNIKTEHFCAVGDNQNSCFGDSGGPIFKKDRGRFHTVGISSFGTSDECTSNSSEFYTNVHTFVPWIKKHMDPKSQLGPDDREMKE